MDLSNLVLEESPINLLLNKYDLSKEEKQIAFNLIKVESYKIVEFKIHVFSLKSTGFYDKIYSDNPFLVKCLPQSCSIIEDQAQNSRHFLFQNFYLILV